MSVVTTVVLITTGMGEDTERYRRQIESFEWAGRTANFAPPIDCCESELVGGSECAESDICIAAFNHLPWDKFVHHLETQVEWNPYHEVVVVLQSNDLDASLVWTNAGTHTEFKEKAN